MTEPTPPSSTVTSGEASNKTLQSTTTANNLNVPARSVTATNSSPVHFGGQGRSLWRFICAWLGPDLQDYTEKELKLEELRHQVRMLIVLDHLLLFSLVFVTATMIAFMFSLFVAILREPRGRSTRCLCLEISG